LADWFGFGATAAQPAAAAPPKEAKDETREKLRAVFDKFDADGSGAVSSAELGEMVKALKLDLSAEQIATLMKEADPDGSGEIEFEEFLSVMRSQVEGGGGLADLVSKAGNLFGWINPLSWFGK